MSKIIKGNFAKAIDYKKIETLKFPLIKDDGIKNIEEKSQNIDYEGLIQQALREKEAILQQGHQEAQYLREQAIEEGFQKGYQEGFNQGKEKLLHLETKFIQSFNNLVAEFESYKEKALKEASTEVQEIALYITKKLINQLVEDKVDLIVDLYKLLLPVVSDKKIIEVVTNPQDNDILTEYFNFTGENGIKVSPSQQIPKGSIKIITEQGYIVYDLKQKLDEIIKELRMLNA
ncbi:Flagellar biosynthesis/type III secretory pathway protein FliH [Anaerobranca californiensis DSM 14826]|uniref:Flagellar biosynthesis/type III secretory pathway protein FliH n=1 Tax=Anaerobranca californiensis DSM 14826 TaxID=1120989 RepID=A0A1M6KJC3_9FIRM|nr:FliH/SctL family protein [Anaerobranca californiensis]SHJ59025.1 Flagellar biosynthesis/type III secretory pathway protein FliH [Anaerobranca californiensis DSM 14826]